MLPSSPRTAVRLAGPSLLATLGLLAPTLAHAASGGPDSFGYYYADSNATGGIPYSSAIFDTVAASGTSLATAGGTDNTAESVTLPFNFTFYGTAYSSLYVCPNGFLSPTSTCSGSNKSFSDNSQVMMAPFWDDLNMDGRSSFVYTYTSGASPNRIYTVAWVKAERNDYEGDVTFAVQLYETSNLIVYQYKDVYFGGDNGDEVDYGRSATAGIDGGATAGYYTQLSYNANSYLTSSLAVAFSTTRAPIAEANGPYTANEGVATTISASGSVGVFGAITAYSFDCTSDGVYDSTGTSSTASCTYPDNGSYTVTVKITNSAGVTATDTATVTVANVAPVPSAAGVTSGYYSYSSAVIGSTTYYTFYVYEGTSVTQTASATDVAADTVTIHYDWGDGTTGTGASGASVAHTFADSGTYDASSYATDEDGGTSPDIWGYLGANLTFSVTNVAPTITSSSGTNSTEATSSSFSATATDPSTTDVLTYAWSYGDGSTGTGASASHQYPNDGTYTWTLTVSDGDGGTATSSGTVTVTNVAPTISSASFGSGSEGSPVAYSVSATDPSSVDQAALTYTWDFGDGSTSTTTSASTTHTYADNGSYSVSVSVSDGTTSVSTSGTSTISNVNPVIGATTWPTTGSEGVSASFSATATDAGILDTLTYLWTWGDGTSSSGSSATHTWADNGSYTVTLTVTDKDGGSTSLSQTMTVSDVAPVITSLTATTPLVEGDTGTFTGAATDVAADTITYTWDYGDGTTGSGASSTHVYADNGTYTVTLTATDNGGAYSTATTSVVVTNANPVVVSITTADGDEGTTLDVSAVATDAGTADILTYTWDYGDGTTGTGNPANHAWLDDGTYTVGLTVTDDDGGSASGSATVTIANVAPIITSTALTTATEASVYDYPAVAVDPGTGDALLWTLSGPDGMSINAATGEVTWTPTYTDSLAPVDVTITVSDGDGGLATQSYTITVTALDSDGDGIPDGWETLHGLNPNDATDAAADPDADGLSNLGEYQAGTDPNVYDGPDAPVLYSPIDNAIVSILTPDLILDDATSPRGNALTYDYEVYTDPAGTILAAATTDVPGPTDATADQTTWTVDVNLPDGALAYWRARADDGLVDGPWTDLAPFFVNSAGDAPSTPVPYSPIDNDVVTTLSPDYIWTIATDPAGGAVTYDVRVMDDTLTTVVDETTGVTDDGADAYADWLTTATLTTGGSYAWEVRAVTDAGIQGIWSEPGYFTVDTSNLAPSDITWLSPVDGDVLDRIDPPLSWSVSVDPEGTAVSYTIDDSTDAAFTDPTEWTADVNQLDLAAAGDVLVENVNNWLRVRATDADGISSNWATIEVFVRGPNDAPTVPVLVSPADASVADSAAPTLVAAASTDPEGDDITYEIVVSASSDLSNPVADGTAIVAADDGTVTFIVPADLAVGTWYWSAQATDSYGATSDWASAWSFDVNGSGDSGGDSGIGDSGVIDTSSPIDSGFQVKPGSCGCDSTTADPVAFGLVWLIGLFSVGRRKVRAADEG